MSLMTTDVALVARDERIKQLEGELSLAEEGLANYAQEVERLRTALTAIREWHCGIPTDCPLMVDAHRIADEALGSRVPQSGDAARYK